MMEPQENKNKTLTYREIAEMAAEIAEKIEKETGKNRNMDTVIIINMAASLLLNRQVQLTTNTF